MRIRIWNAFASNNSGAYTLIGSFASPDRATEFAAELQALFARQDNWVREMRELGTSESTSPLRQAADAAGLPADLGAGEDDDWPEYDEPTIPQVVSIGHQVLVHHPYTVSMPAIVGGLFYTRAGRVTAELNHTHHPLLLRMIIYADWQQGLKREQEAARMRAIGEVLLSDDGVAKRHSGERGHVWRDGEAGNMELIIAPDDIVAAAREISGVVYREGLRIHLAILEADEGEPLGMFR